MYYDASVIKGQDIDIKIIDEELMHHFEIWPDNVKYEISRNHGRDLIARPVAELVDLKDNRILIQTDTHLFEIVPGPTFYRAYKQLKK